MTTASDRLRALGGAMKNARTRGIVTTVAGYNLFTEVNEALPLIADVVEAAEKATEKNWPNHPLVVALTALREHLEGGDRDIKIGGSSMQGWEGGGVT